MSVIDTSKLEGVSILISQWSVELVDITRLEVELETGATLVDIQAIAEGVLVIGVAAINNKIKPFFFSFITLIRGANKWVTMIG